MNPEVTYIIPISNSGKVDFNYRRKNLQFIYDSFISKQEDLPFECIFVEQVTNQSLPTYHKFIKIKDNTQFIHINWPIFNKGWCINVAAKMAKAPVIMIGEADCVGLSSHYFSSIVNKFISAKLKWAFAWDTLQYLSKDESIQFMQGSEVNPSSCIVTPRPNGAEGGILIYDKDWYLKIGGHNEWIQGLGGPDNEMADRAKWWSKTYEQIYGELYHIWHPIIKQSARRDKYRSYNRQIIKVQRYSMGTIARLIASHPIGNVKYPACALKTYLKMRTGCKK